MPVDTLGTLANLTPIPRSLWFRSSPQGLTVVPVSDPVFGFTDLSPLRMSRILDARSNGAGLPVELFMEQIACDLYARACTHAAAMGRGAVRFNGLGWIRRLWEHIGPATPPQVETRQPLATLARRQQALQVEAAGTPLACGLPRNLRRILDKLDEEGWVLWYPGRLLVKNSSGELRRDNPGASGRDFPSWLRTQSSTDPFLRAVVRMVDVARVDPTVEPGKEASDNQKFQALLAKKGSLTGGRAPYQAIRVLGTGSRIRASLTIPAHIAGTGQAAGPWVYWPSAEAGLELTTHQSYHLDGGLPRFLLWSGDYRMHPLVSSRLRASEICVADTDRRAARTALAKGLSYGNVLVHVLETMRETMLYGVKRSNTNTVYNSYAKAFKEKGPAKLPYRILSTPDAQAMARERGLMQIPFNR